MFSIGLPEIHQMSSTQDTPAIDVALLTKLSKFIARRQYDAAAEQLEILTSLYPDSDYLLGEQARLACARRDFAVVPQLYARLVKTGDYAGSDASAAAISKAFRAQNLFDDAEAAVLIGLKRYPQSGLLLMELAEIHMARRNWAKAVTFWNDAKTALEKAPAILFVKLSVALKNSRKEAASKEALLSGLELYPTDTSILRALLSKELAKSHWREAAKYSSLLLSEERNVGKLMPVDAVQHLLIAHNSEDAELMQSGLKILQEIFPDGRERDVLLEEIRATECARDDNSVLTLPTRLIVENFPRHLCFKILLIRLRRGSRGLGSYPVLEPVLYAERDNDWLAFQKLFEDNLGYFLHLLSSRFMLSVVDTYTDFSSGEDRAVSLLIASIFVSERNAYTLRCMFEFKPRKKVLDQKQIPMWDGFYSNRLAGDDVYKVWFNRLETVLSCANPVLAGMFFRLFLVMIESEGSTISLNCQYGPRLAEHVALFAKRFNMKMESLPGVA